MAPIAIPAVLRELPALEPARPAAPAAAPGEAGSFGEALGQALASVEKAQVDADASAEQVALGGGNLHETALALEKADVALRVATKVRNKLVDAYQEVMRMSV